MATDPLPASGRLRLGEFEVDLGSHELLRAGRRVRLQEKSFLVLRALLDRAGEVVPREALTAALWPEDYHVDAEHGLNTAVRRLREALGDSAETPRFVETLPRIGYRLVAAVEEVYGAPDPRDPATEAEVVGRASNRRRWTVLLAAGAAIGVALAIGHGLLRLVPETGGPRPPRDRNAEVVAELVARGRYLTNVKRFGDARTFFEQALELDPGNGDALGGLALSLVPSGERQAAREFARRALELDPRSSDAHAALGHLARDGADLATAERHFRSSIEADTESAKARNRLARLLLELGEVDAAARQIDEAHRLDPNDPDVQNIRLEYRLRRGDYEGAIRDGQSWIAIWAPEIDVRVTNTVRDMLGLAYLGARRHEDALREFRTIDPSDRLRTALTLAHSGHAEEARSIVEGCEASAVAPDPGRAGALAMVDVLLGDFDAAFDQIDRQIEGRLYPGWLHCPLFAALRGDARFADVERTLARVFQAGEPEPDERPVPLVLQQWPRPLDRAAAPGC